MKILVFLFPVILFLIFLLIKISLPYTYKELIKEDAVVENAQALFYFVSSIFSFLAAKKFMKNKLVLHGVLYGVLAIGLFFISGEEISWGQRIFNITTTDYFEQHNWQHETNIHNLDIIKPLLLHKAYILIGTYGAFAWLFALLFVPGARTKRNHLANFVVPDWYISSYFFFSFFIFTVLVLTKKDIGGFIWMKDQEIAELLLAMGFLFFAVNNYIKLRIYLATGELQTKLQENSNKYWAYMIGIILIIIVPGTLFTLSQKAHIKKSIQEVEIESLEVDTPSRTINLLKNYKALCSNGKCTDPEKAIEYMNEVIKLDPDSIIAYKNRGTVYIESGQYKKAIQDFSEVIRRKPNHVKARYNRGMALLKAGQYQAAIQDFDRSIIQKPDYADAYNDRGKAYIMQGYKSLGCRDAQKACDLGTCRTIEEAKKRGYCSETN
jgi:tetratricopeptide (TPR) repeat protein